MKIEGMSLTLHDLKEMISSRIEEEMGEVPENMTFRFTLDEDVSEVWRDGIDTLDLEIEDEAEEVFLLTWSSEASDQSEEQDESGDLSWVEEDEEGS